MDIKNNGDDFLSVFKTRAVVIKTQDYKETDKLVWLFTEKLGKISTIVHGAKRKMSNLSFLTLPFCFGEFVVYKGRSLYSINEGEIINSFQTFLNDLETLTYASYLCELIDISMPDGESSRELFRELVTAFYIMESGVGDIEVMVRTFELKLLQYTGYGLNLDRCAICKNKIKTSKYISFQYYGGVCENCDKENCMRINYSTYNTFKFLNKIPIEKAYKVVVDKNVKNELYTILSEFISQSYSRKAKSLDFINLLRRKKNE